MTRIYAALKRQVVTGVFAPGARLDPSRLKDDLAASTMPIRDTLQRLTGEGLVENSHNEGFRIVQLSEAAVRDLYEWCGDLVRLCLDRAEFHSDEPARELTGSYAEDLTRLLLRIAALSPNHEHRRAMTSLCERSYLLRTLEERLLGDAFEDMLPLKTALDDRFADQAMIAFGKLQERRLALLTAIVASLRDRGANKEHNIF